jgi:hypothetical protein
MPLMIGKASNDDEQRPQEDRNLNIFAASIGLGYTPNPSLVPYPSVRSSQQAE